MDRLSVDPPELSDEQRAAGKEGRDVHKSKRGCTRCGRAGHVEATVRVGEDVLRSTQPIQLAGSPPACQFCRADVEALTGEPAPGRRCDGIDGAGCLGTGFRDGHRTLCRGCACNVPCPGVGEGPCEFMAFRDGHNTLCRGCACKVPCPGVGGNPCKYKAFRDAQRAACSQCLSAEQEARLSQMYCNC